MPQSSQPVLDFLLTRRSRPAKTLVGPGLTKEQLLPILTAGGRTPDHGKLEPWRFIVLDREACLNMAESVETRAQTLDMTPEQTSKAVSQFENAYCVVTVVASPKESPKVPLIEQTLSAGAVCLSVLNAALASGWGANWLTGWAAFDEDIAGNVLHLNDGEFVAGFIHIGTETNRPPERPRPNIDAITTWL